MNKNECILTHTQIKQVISTNLAELLHHTHNSEMFGPTAQLLFGIVLGPIPEAKK
jgi:hypothetical protein